MEFYSALRRKEILSHATPWMNLEDITLSKISLSKKRQKVYICLYEISKGVKFIETESIMCLLEPGEGRGKGKCNLVGIEFQICKCSEAVSQQREYN